VQIKESEMRQAEDRLSNKLLLVARTVIAPSSNATAFLQSPLERVLGGSNDSGMNGVVMKKLMQEFIEPDQMQIYEVMNFMNKQSKHHDSQIELSMQKLMAHQDIVRNHDKLAAADDQRKSLEGMLQTASNAFTRSVEELQHLTKPNGMGNLMQPAFSPAPFGYVSESLSTVGGIPTLHSSGQFPLQYQPQQQFQQTMPQEFMKSIVDAFKQNGTYSKLTHALINTDSIRGTIMGELNKAKNDFQSASLALGYNKNEFNKAQEDVYSGFLNYEQPTEKDEDDEDEE